MPEFFIAAFDAVAPEAATAAFDTAAFEGIGAGLGAEAGLGGAGFLEGMSGVNALENPAVAQQMANQQMAQGVASGGVGAAQGTAEQLAAQQARAVEAANSGLTSRGITSANQFAPPDIGTSNVSNIVQNAGRGTQVADMAQTFDPGQVKTVSDAGAPNPIFQQGPRGVDYSFNTGSINNIQTPGYQSYLTRPDLASGASTGTQALSAGISDGGVRTAMSQLPAPEPSALEQGFNTATKFIKENPYSSAAAAYMGASKLGLLNQPRAQFGDVNAPYNGPLNNYRLSPDFKGRFADPTQYQYTPRYAEGGIMGYAAGGPVEQMSNNAAIGANTMYPMANMMTSSFATPYQTPQSTNMMASMAPSGGGTVDQMSGEPNMQGTRLAEGGIAHFAKGNLADSLDYYNNQLGGVAAQQMAEARIPAGGKGDIGIFRDADPDTAYLSAPEAAAVRMGKINARANMQGLTLPRPKPINKINLKPQGVQQAAASGSSLDPEMAAAGGIMGANLGGYAAGGNPRLLKGPGDGMSDDIPATIANRQPARLADGEFVVPADVVSHLGNGSTEAGAKKLHHMMDSVRKARTGNSKQGKQINPNKYLPK